MSEALMSTVFWCLAAAGLAGLAAVAELVGRFKDAPQRAVTCLPGVSYLLLNGLLAALIVAGLRYGNMPQTKVTIIEQVLLGCLVARVVVRTRVTALKSADGVVTETGPGQFSERMLAAIERDLERERASQRLRKVSERMVGIEWSHGLSFFGSELLAAMQGLSANEERRIHDELATIESRTDLDEETRVDMLGYLVLDHGGEDILDRLVRLYHVRFPLRAAQPAMAA